MKTLRKRDEFKRVSEKNIKEARANQILINAGWKYCPKSEYKDFYRTVVKDEEVKESTAKRTKADKKKSDRRK